jgi:replicative DNA helicase
LATHFSKTNVRAIRRAEDFEGLQEIASPHSSNAERAILGTILLCNDLMGQAIGYGIEPYMMYVKAHDIVFGSMFRIFNRGGEINPILLGEDLRREGLIEQVGGVAFISELTYGLPHFTNLLAYAKVVKNKWKLREALKVQRLNEALILAEEEDTDEILAQVETNTLEVVGAALRDENVRSQEFVDVGEDEGEFRATLEAYHLGHASGLETPFEWLNDKLEGGGLQPQNLYIIAAAPKVGKTSFLLRLANHWANVLQVPGGILTMEMRRMALEMRMFAQYAGIPYWMFRKGFRGPEYKVAMASIGPFFQNLRRRLFMVDSISTLAQFRQAARRVVLGPTQAKWLATDYIQLMSASRDPDPYQRAADVGAVTRGLKKVAQELNVPLVAISTLNQDGEREGRRPEPTDLAWTGDLRYAAEALIFLHNSDYKRAMTREQKMEFDEMKSWAIDLMLSYQRNGPTGERRLTFIKDMMRFEDAGDSRVMTSKFERDPMEYTIPFGDEGPQLLAEGKESEAWLT